MSSLRPRSLTLDLYPQARFDAIDVVAQVRQRLGDVLRRFRSVLYCSHHTTAGYLEERLARRLEARGGGIDPFFRGFQRIFPPGAGYFHDEMGLRDELSEEQREVEPPNGDAHLTYIGSGLQNCVTYPSSPAVPVYFMDLDGIYQGRARHRTTSIVAYNEEEPVAEFTCDVPVSRHAIDSVNLNDHRLGIREQIQDLLATLPIDYGRIEIAVDDGETETAVTVNEYETLLMRHDLAEVLRDPLRFMARQSRRMLRNPRAVPAKSLGYARYDVVRVLNEVMDALGLSESAVERLVARVMAFPASRMLRWKRSLNLAVVAADNGRPQVVQGRYQSPILIQWSASPRRARRLRVAIHRFH